MARLLGEQLSYGSFRAQQLSHTFTKKLVYISHINMDIQVLWELDQPKTNLGKLPTFPMRKINDRYEADLLWKGAERPIDNIVQAKATLDSLTRKLKRENIKERYEQTLSI